MAQELEYVVNGALMSCNQGTVPQPIIVTSNSMAKAAGMPVATDADKVAITNIPPFGICQILTKSNPVPCVPALVQWLETKTDVNVNFCKPLMSNSCAMCSVGGKVEFLMNGQLPMPPEIKEQIEEAKALADEILAEAEKEKNAVGETGFFEGMIPLWGSGRDTVHNYQMGNYGMTALNGGFFVLDCLSLGVVGVLRGAAKGGIKAAVRGATRGLSKKAAAAVAKAKVVKEGLEKIVKEAVEKMSLKVFKKGVVKTGSKTVRIFVKVSDPGTPALRKELAEEFYKKAGWSKERIDDHIKGIDFTKPVEIVEIPKGASLSQWQAPGGSKGSYFSEKGTNPSDLGISPNSADYYNANNRISKIESDYVSDKPVEALKSTSSPAKDTWSESIKGPDSPNSFTMVRSTDTTGGATQYFIPENSAFK